LIFFFLFLYSILLARQLRIEYERAFYHVTSRGNQKEDIFFDDRDRGKFLEIRKTGVKPSKFKF